MQVFCDFFRIFYAFFIRNVPKSFEVKHPSLKKEVMKRAENIQFFTPKDALKQTPNA